MRACTSLVSLGAMRSTVFGSNSTFQPLGPEPDNSTCSAAAVPVLVTTIGTEVSAPALALVLRIPSRPAMSILGWPVMSTTKSVVTTASSAVAFALTLVLPAATVFGGRTLNFTSLDWPGSSGSALSSWLPYCSVKVPSQFSGTFPARPTVTFLPLSFLIESWNSKVDLEVPRSSGSCGVTDNLAGRSVASRTSTGSVTSLVGPLAVTIRSVVPTGASFGTSTRSSNDTLELVAGSAAAIGCPPPISVADQPAGAPDTDSASRSGGRL